MWSTKYRFEILRGDLRLKVREIIRQVCAENGVEIVRGVLSSDHVHMFVSVPLKLAISDIVRKMEDWSSHRVQLEFPAIRKRYWGQQFWGSGYFLMTSGITTQDIVLQNCWMSLRTGPVLSPRFDPLSR